MINSRNFGPILVNISDEEQFLTAGQINDLESFINNKWMRVVPNTFQPVNYPMTKLNGKPSLALRVDCSPDKMEQGIYEVDANPYGIAFSTLAQNSTLMAQYIACLKALGISAVKVKTYKSAMKLDSDADVFKKHLTAAGIRIADDAPHAQLWASNFDVGTPGFNDDLRKSLMYSLESKLNLVPLGLAILVSTLFTGGMSDEGIKGILTRNYPDGYVVKPIDGWGCGYNDPIGFKIVSTKKPFKPEGDTQTAGVKMIRQILDANRGKEYIVQPFYPPRITKLEGQTGFQLYRLYLVLDPESGKYKFAGGWYNFSKSLKGHGSNGTVFGWVREN